MSRYYVAFDNAHCEACEDDIRSVLEKQDPRVVVKFLQNRQLVQIDTSVSDFNLKSALAELHDHGFDLHLADLPSRRSANGRRSSALSALSDQRGGSLWTKLKNVVSRNKNRELNHAQICLECGSSGSGGGAAGGATTSTSDNVEAFRAVFAVEGMTCASCASNITEAIKSSIPDVLNVSADPIQGAAFVLLPNRNETTKAAQAIEDAGYKATLTEILPLNAHHVKEFSIEGIVGGMTCASCSATVKHGLEALAYVSSANVEVLDGRAEIITTKKVPLSEIKEAVEDLGYSIEFKDEGFREIHSAQANHRARTVTLEVQNIFCERCPDRIMNVLRAYGDAVDILDPVSMSIPYVKFTYLPSPPKMTIRSILGQLAEANPDLGFEVVRPRSLEEIAAENQARELRAIKNRLILASLMALPTALLMFSSKAMMNYKVMFMLAFPVYFFATDIFHRKAIKEIRGVVSDTRKPWSYKLLHFGSMNLLMSLGTSISFWASVVVVIQYWRRSQRHHHTEPVEMPETFFDSVVFLAFFLLIGRYLDLYSKCKTMSIVSLASKGRPDTVELWNESTDSTKQVPIDLVEVGDYVSVFPGQRSAVDGVVRRGSSDFDESMLTGEALPVPKSAGDEVYAGTLNSGQQALVMKVTAVSKGTLLNDIVDAVHRGSTQRAPIESYAEQFTGVFVPIVVYLALLVWLVWYLVSKDVMWSMQFAISTFVVACPCGIGLAAPTALYVGTGLAAKYGILARGGGDAFNEGSRVQVMCFDKTGTITVGGDLRIVDTFGAESDEAVQLATRLESDSVHPLAKAVKEYGYGRKVTSAKCENIQQIEDRGRGMKADVTGGDYTGKVAVMGNEEVIKQVARVEPTKEQRKVLDKWKNSGYSVILMAIVDHGVVLMFAAADQVRRESREVVHRLEEQGVRCWMISGDNPETARAVARKVGIQPDNVIAGVLPAQKAQKIKDLQMTSGASTSQYGRAIVGMVGDGVNDAPALATSDVGVAIGRGADIALSSSQFVLLRDDLRALPILIAISKVVMKRVKLNFFWAAFYNIVAIPVAAGVFYPWTHQRLDPVWASLAMTLSSFSVMTSSLLIRRWHPKEY